MGFAGRGEIIRDPGAYDFFWLSFFLYESWKLSHIHTARNEIATISPRFTVTPFIAAYFILTESGCFKFDSARDDE